LDDVDFKIIENIYGGLIAQGRTEIATTFPEIEIQSAVAFDMRYVGQEHAVTVDIPEEIVRKHDRSAIRSLFDEEHKRRYGYAPPDGKGDIVGLRCSVTGLLPKPVVQTLRPHNKKTPAEALLEYRPVYFGLDAGEVSTPVYRREKLLAGDSVAGPALIEEHASTTVVCEGDSLTVDQFGNLSISIGLNGRSAGDMR
jgi:N-methylhydantoinase A